MRRDKLGMKLREAFLDKVVYYESPRIQLLYENSKQPLKEKPMLLLEL